jgi:hypothetical protein
MYINKEKTMSQSTYRIIFFKDSRYGNIERYTLVKGTYLDALAEIKRLETLEFVTYVSRYYTVDRQFVSDLGIKEPKLKPLYKVMGHEKTHNKNL